MSRVRMIALYLPQFYPTPENDRWWGAGFTEWRNVARARPLFVGHEQPHLPADLGFYDLRVPESREAQAAMARAAGIEGFCYWHYWFHGTRLLNRPFEEVLASGRPDFPFCLAWANETWSRRWHGMGSSPEVLQAQAYSPDDDVAHARWLVGAFADPRYITVDGRPLFMVYRPTDLPEPRRTVDVIKGEAVRAGLPEPYVLGSNSHADRDYRTYGFDSTLEFEPQFGVLPSPTRPGLKIFDYTVARLKMTARSRNFPTVPCVVVRWDNTARRGEHGIVFTDATPETFEAGLREAVRRVREGAEGNNIVFVNAWNEWAEGNHLEPDLRWGTQYLDAVRRVLDADEASSRIARRDDEGLS